MRDELITYETALLAKDKGWNQRGSYMYDRHNEIQTVPSIKHIFHEGGMKAIQTPQQLFAPTQTTIHKWLRKKHNIHISLTHKFNGYYECDVYSLVEDEFEVTRGYSMEYEEALETGIFEALKLIEE